jgi:hypothetical protein
MRQMIQVLYSSKTKTDISQNEINDILEVSRKNNQKNKVTGILLYRNREFLQLLEGERINVYYTLKKIMEDQRHTNVNVFYENEIQKSLFNNWSMAFKSESDLNPEIGQRLEQLKLSPNIVDDLALVTLLNSFFYSKPV